MYDLSIEFVLHNKLRALRNSPAGILGKIIDHMKALCNNGKIVNGGHFFFLFWRNFFKSKLQFHSCSIEP